MFWIGLVVGIIIGFMLCAYLAVHNLLQEHTSKENSCHKTIKAL